MKLDEFHVADAAACAPGHGDAVAGGSVRIGGIQVNLAGAAGSQYRVPSGKSIHLAGFIVERVDTVDAPLVATGMPAGDEIDGQMVFEQSDIGVAANFIGQRGLHRTASGIRCMYDPSFAVSALAGQVVARIRGIVPGEGDPLIDQPVDHLPSLACHETSNGFIAQTGACHQRIADMGFHRVVGIEHGSDAALCPCACAIHELALGQEGDLFVRRQMQGGGQGCQPAAYDQNFGF
jgi:hypothetical protein